MRDLGYIDGRDFDMVSRYAEGIQDRLPALAEEIVGLKPDVSCCCQCRSSGTRCDIGDPDRLPGAC
jgi:hypothetical protein